MAFWNRNRATPDSAPPSEPGIVDPQHLYSRNFAFISQETQSRLGLRALYLAGVGLSSNIAVAAARTGFARFILADNDVVDVSNLNRQAYTLADVGRNKAEALRDIVRAIRPDAIIETVPMRLDEHNSLPYLGRADVVVNSIEYDEPAFFTLNDAAQAAGKSVLVPVNLGWGGAVLAFTPMSPRLATFIGYDPRVHQPTDVAPLLIQRIFTVVPGGPPAYLTKVLNEYVRNETGWAYDPQLAIAANLTSALAVRATVALLNGEPVRAVPDVMYCDALSLTTPNARVPVQLPSSSRLSAAQ